VVAIVGIILDCGNSGSIIGNTINVYKDCNMTEDRTTDFDDDAKVERMRKEFEAFMLSGTKKPIVDESIGDSSSSCQHDASHSKKKKKKKKGKQSFCASAKVNGGGAGDDYAPPTMTPSGSTATTPILGQCRKSMSRTTDKKRYFQLLRSFNDKVQHNWLDTDDQMLSIIENIVSIRARLPIEWKVLQFATTQLASSSTQRDMNPQCGIRDDVTNMHLKNGDHPWKYCGFLGKPKEVPYSTVHLHIDDIQLALSNDLMQHEKMLVELRKHISQLAECHDAVGRVVDTLWQFHLECCSVLEAQEDEPQDDAEICDDIDNDLESNIMQGVTKVFHMLSMELHRKQGLVPLILESTKDELLGISADEAEFMVRNNIGVQGIEVSVGGDGSDDAYEKSTHGLRVARKCCKVWKRSSDETCVDVSLVAYLVKLGGGEV
jgi:hypothetical protein